ncbi:MAG: DUF4376 domain-containing protein [Prevotella sp.]|nr:DUF4376 domain-containing protein [Prevotella sp.]
MKKYQNQTTGEWYTEGQSMTRVVGGSLFSGVPSEEQLSAWGFEEWHEPEPTQEELLERAKAAKIAELEAYDASEAVNGFTIGGVSMWLDAPTRQQLRISLDACYTMGRESASKWFNGVQYTFPINAWYQMLTALEVYAADALNVTESHRAAINGLDSIEAVEGYDYTTDYPSKLSF